tara:strand:- start:1740 stop:2291 length:552 start_codon:yes stop_codon:yes gene_type:complete
MIFETIICTTNNKGSVNFAPFGIKKNKKHIFISPYIPSTTLNNLEETGNASINYIDDAAFFVNCIIGKKNFKKKMCSKINCFFLKDALAHDEVVVESIKANKVRPIFKCKIINKEEHKRFEGFNRARNSLIEACILASRVKILKKKQILKELEGLENSVEKTAGIKERKSWNLISKFILNETK